MSWDLLHRKPLHFFEKVKIEKGIPFELKIPNETTIKAMNEAKNLEGEVCSLEEFVK